MRNIGKRLERNRLLHGRRRRGVPEQFPREPVELVFRAYRRKLLLVDLSAAASLPVGINRRVGADGDEKLGDLRVLRAGGDLLRQFSLEHGGIGYDPLDVAEFLQKFLRRLAAYAADSGNVVGSVSGKREIIDHLPRILKMPVFADLRLVVDLRAVTGMGGTVKPDARTHKLRGVLVGSGHENLEPGRSGLHRERPHHVVGLETVASQNRNPHRLGKFKRIRNRRGEIFRHFLTLRLVRRVRLVPERGPLRIHRENDVSGRFFFQNRTQAVHQPEQRGSVDSGSGHARIA